MPMDDITGEFLVRVKAGAKEKAEELLGTRTVLQLPGHPEETALLTGEMSQGEYFKKAAELGDDLISMIRIKD